MSCCVSAVTETAQAYLAAALAAALMGLMGLMVRWIPLPPEAIALTRFGLGWLLLVGFLTWRQPGILLRLQFSPYAALSGLWLGLCCLCYFKAVLLTSLGTAAILLYLGPLLAALLALALLGERLSWLGSLLLGLAFCGCLLIFGNQMEFGAASRQGNLLALLSAVFYAGFILCNRLTAPTVTPLVRAFHQLLTAALTLVPWVLSSLGQAPPPAPGGWLLLLGAIALLQGFGAILLTARAMKALQAYQFGTVSYLEPVIAVVVGLSLYGETLGAAQAFGALLILGASVGQTLVSSPRKMDC